MGVNKKCTRCGEKIYNVHPNTKYCIKCRDALEAAKYGHRATYEFKKPCAPPKRKQKKPAKSIVEVVKEAREAGLSYGQYQLQLNTMER